MPGRALLARLRALFRAVVHRDDVESEIQAEFQHHLELRTAEGDVDGAALELKDLRDEARASRDWPKADEYRDQLVAMGYDVEDTAAGTVIRKR